MRPKSRATNLILTFTLGFVVFQENMAAQDFWQRINGPYGGTIRSLAVSESGFLFAGTDRGLYRSTNGGAGWQQVADIPLDVAVSAILLHPSGAILAGTMYEGIWRSADNGETWKKVGLTGIDVRAIVCDSLGQIYAGTYNKGIYFSTDQGVNWASFALSRESVFALFSTSSGVLLAGVTDGVFRSDDSGQNWVFVEINDTNVHSFVENSCGYIFAATSDKGIFRSVDGGESWTQINNGLTARFVLPIARYLQDEIFVGTDGNGIFRSIDVTGTKPESFSFLQNYPNPFNATTTIEFQLETRSLVRLAIYNLSGQKIATLVDQELSPGIYPIRWDAKRVASGIYLCRIRTEQVSETIKLLLVK